MKRENKEEKPTVAPGDDKFLDAKPSKEDLKKGNFTRVTTLSYDEADPSRE
jgi:hypothetical protein